MNKLIRAVALLLMISMIGACTGKAPESDKTPEEPEVVVDDKTAEEEPVEEPVAEPEPEPEPVVPEYGGTLNIAMSPADSLDPLENRIDNVNQVLDLLYEGLFTLDTELRPVPELVASFSYILDGKGIELVLKEGVLFHDGSPMTGADVAYTVNTIRESKTSPYKPLVLPIARVSTDKDDERIVRFYYDQAYAFMLQDLTFPIVSATYSKSSAFDPMVPVGTGPYKYVDYQSMQHLDLTANEVWHGGSLYVEDIHVVAMNEDSNMETLFDQHLIDVMTPPKFNWLKYSEKDDQRIESYETSYCDFIGFSPMNELLQDTNLRKAIAYAVDREALVYNQFIDHALVADTPIVPGSWFNSGNDLTYVYNAEEAMAYAHDAFVKDNDGDGYFDVADAASDTGFTNINFRMLVNSASANRIAAAPVIAHYINELGFEVTVEALDSAEYYERMTAGDYDLVYGGWKLTAKPDFMSMFSSEGSQNYFGYASEEMDLTLQSLMNSKDEATVIQRVNEFEDLFLEDMPFVMLYFMEGAVMYHGDTYGDLAPTAADAFNSINDIYLDLTKE